jgi:acyl-CoA dehydrogenase
MNFELTEEQQMLQDSLRRFLANEYTFEKRRKVIEAGQGSDESIWNALAEMGLLAFTFPEDYDGLGGNSMDTMLVMESFGRALVTEPYLATVVLAGGLVRDAGSHDQKQAILPAIASGEKLMALAAYENGARYNLANVKTKAEASGNDYVLNGAKTAVIHGGQAHQLIVSTRTSGDTRDQNGITLFLVDPKAEGVNVERTIFPDGRNYAKVTLENVALGADAVLGEKDQGSAPLQKLLDIGSAHLAAELLGLSSEAFDRTVAYMKERKQFGVYVSSFQALQHRAAHMWSELEQVKSLVLKAFMALDAGDEQAPVLVSAAKAKASQVAELVTNEGVQLHGGMGMTDEYDIGLFMKRARPVQLMLGDFRYHADRVASLKGF